LDAGGGQRNDGRWQEISGYRHLLTFADGPRACLGKGFALAEIKVCIVLLWYSFLMMDEWCEGCPLGIDTKLYFRVPRRKGS